MKFFDDFKAFISKGNVIDMAVGVIIGGAFGKIVSSFVADIIMPPIGVLIGGIDFTDLKWTIKSQITDAVTNEVKPAVSINYGVFLQNTIDFLIIAFCIFLFIRAINQLQRKKEETPAPPPAPSKEETLLTEIRDILKEKNNK